MPCGWTTPLVPLKRLCFEAAECAAGSTVLVLVEGQGSLCHPGLHVPPCRCCGAAQPTALLLVHRASAAARLSGCLRHSRCQAVVRALVALTEGLARLARPADAAEPARVRRRRAEYGAAGCKRCPLEMRWMSISQDAIVFPAQTPIRWGADPTPGGRGGNRVLSAR